jgi:hypothetical protein
MTKRKRGSVSGTLGGIIVGFDQQIFRTTPPVQELVAKGQPVRGLSGEGGGDFAVVFPDELDAPAHEPAKAGEDARDPTAE